MPETEPLPRVTYDLAQIACELGYVPPPLLSPHVFVDASRFKSWRCAFSKPILDRLDSFQCPTVTWLEAKEYDGADSPFSVGEKRALKERGGFFAFHRIVPERFSSQGRPHVSDAEAYLRQCLAVEIFRRSAEIELLLKELENTEPLRDYVDAFSLIVDRVPMISELAKAKASHRDLDRPKGDGHDLVDSLLHRLFDEGRRTKFCLFGQAIQSGAGLRDNAVEAIRAEIKENAGNRGIIPSAICRRVSLIAILVKAYLRATLVAATERKLARREAKRAGILRKHPNLSDEVIISRGRLGKKKIEAANRSGDKYDNGVLVDPSANDSHMLDFGEMILLATYTGSDPLTFNFKNLIYWPELEAARLLGDILRGGETDLTYEQAKILDRQGPPQEARSCPIEYAALVAFHENVARATRLLEFGLGVGGAGKLK